jgi:hypothetical protein
LPSLSPKGLRSAEAEALERLADSHIKEACRRRPRSSPSWSTSPTSRASPTRKSLTSWARRWAPYCHAYTEGAGDCARCYEAEMGMDHPSLPASTAQNPLLGEPVFTRGADRNKGA